MGLDAYLRLLPNTFDVRGLERRQLQLLREVVRMTYQGGKDPLAVGHPLRRGGGTVAFEIAIFRGHVAVSAYVALITVSRIVTLLIALHDDVVRVALFF